MTHRQWLILQSALADYKNALIMDRGSWDDSDGPYPEFGEVDELNEELADIVTVIAPENDR